MLPACSSAISDGGAPTVDEEALEARNSGTFGDPLAGLTADELARFDFGKDHFAEEEAIEEGLGPVFNDRACGNCHLAGAEGGAGTRTVTRFGTTTDGVFDPLAQFGGSLIQSQGIGPIVGADGTTCNYVAEQVPAEATIVAHRLTTPLFGLGLVDAVPDGTFQTLARIEALLTPGTAGVPNIVSNPLTGGTSVGKFGWKAQVPSLLVFSGDAYLNEMGITNPIFPNENCPQGDCAILACDPKADPEDDGTDMNAFADFMTLLGPPPPGPVTGQVVIGGAIFAQVGCANCHLPVLRTGSSPVAALNNVVFRPFSDFLLHDMGSLGDGIAQAQASGSQIRTAPLWGLRTRPLLLHDGRATTVADAIAAHDGQGARARDRFAALGSAQQAALVAFVNAL